MIKVTFYIKLEFTAAAPLHSYFHIFILLNSSLPEPSHSLSQLQPSKHPDSIQFHVQSITPTWSVWVNLIKFPQL